MSIDSQLMIMILFTQVIVGIYIFKNIQGIAKLLPLENKIVF